MTKKALLLVPLILFALAVQPAVATPITLSLGVANSDIAGYTGPYGTVTISLSGNVATATFTALDGGGYHYLFGDGGSVALNVNATTFTSGTITGSDQPQSPNRTPEFTVGQGGVDGFGSFNFKVDNFDGYQNSVRTVTFTLTNTSGTWSSENDVLTANAEGYLAGAHIFVANGDYTSNPSTGYAANGTTSVPDGGMTMTLLGLALAGMGMVARRFR